MQRENTDAILFLVQNVVIRFFILMKWLKTYHPTDKKKVLIWNGFGYTLSTSHTGLVDHRISK